MQQSILKHLEVLIRCDTQNPPRQIETDHEIFAYINSVLEAAGNFSVQITDHNDGRICYLATRGHPKVLFNVHLDTVPIGSGWTREPLNLAVENGRAFGRGVCDIKGAAAVLLAIAEETELPLALLFTTDEEGANSCCVERFSHSVTKADYTVVIVAEPTQCEAVLGHRGYLSVLGEFAGQPGHSSELRGLADNAVHKACKWASAAIDFANTENENGNGICFNIGSISGGSGSNVIAASASVHWSARLPPGADNSATLSSICNLTDAAGTIKWNARFNGSPLPASGFNDRAAGTFCQRKDLLIGASVDFWTEASHFSAAGLPAIVLGPGNIEQAHTADEWVQLDQLWLAAEIYQRLSRET